jgi:hypothetical protein
VFVEDGKLKAAEAERDANGGARLAIIDGDRIWAKDLRSGTLDSGSEPIPPVGRQDERFAWAVGA